MLPNAFFIHFNFNTSFFSFVVVVIQLLSHVWLFWPHGLQHASPCPSPSPGVCSNSCLLSQWYHPNISSCFIPFFSCLQSFPAAESFLMRWLFASSGQSIDWSFSFSISISQSFQRMLKVDFLWDWLVWYFRPRDSQESSPAPHFKSINSLELSLFLWYYMIWIRISKWSFWDKERDGSMCFCVFSSVKLPQENTSWTVWKTKCFNGTV